MQKMGIFWFILLLGVDLDGHAQTNQRNRTFVGKWEITVADTPEIKFTTNLVRKKGRLTGELTDARNPAAPKLPITKVEEKGQQPVDFLYIFREKRADHRPDEGGC